MRAILALLLSLLPFVAGCAGTPPQKELDRAQGAIDAARAAGAEQYAPEAFDAATSALEQAHEAAGQRDYRLALTRALDAHDQAQEAARGAADGKARVRSEAEAALAQADAALQQLEARVTADTPRLPRRALTDAREAHEKAETVLQETRAALTTGAYIEARKEAIALTERIQAALKELEAAQTAKPTRRRR